MPKYDLACKKCGRIVKITKAKKSDPNPNCEFWNCLSDRTFVLDRPKKNKPFKIQKSGLTFIGTKVEDAEYNPGLGCITKNKRHREEIAKRLGVVEIGNDYKSPNDIHSTNDKALAEKRKKAWDSV